MQTILAAVLPSDGEGAPLPVWLPVLLGAVLAVEALLAASLMWSNDVGQVLIFGILFANLCVVTALALLPAAILSLRRETEVARDDEILEMSRRLDLALEVSRIGFWDVDLDTDQLTWDVRACQLMCVDPASGPFTEKDWLRAIHPDDRERASEAAQAVIDEGGHFVSDYRIVAADGEVRHVRDMATPYLSSEGRPRLAGLFWDVTADKMREAELEQKRSEAEAADRAKSNFLASMSHEIRTPLAGVIGMLDLILSDELPAEQAERARVARASADSLKQLLNDVLDVCKLEQASMTLSPLPVAPRAAVGDVVDLMAASARQKGLALSSTVADDVPGWVSLDPVRFRQVLTNIVSNALAYTDAGHVAVEVAWSAPESALRVAVQDSGIGIAAADTARIFERFVQAETLAPRPAQGTGLGLAIARELVELMGGIIEVDSEAGVGSTFTFTVRAELCAAPDAPAETVAAPDADAPARCLDVLVADDNATNRLLVRSLLRRAGHNVTLVENGQKALDAVQSQNVDLVLMDIQMPVMDGLAATRAIRRLDPPVRAPIVALTASLMPDDADRYREAGVEGLLAKPIDIAALTRVLADAAARAGPA